MEKQCLYYQVLILNFLFLFRPRIDDSLYEIHLYFLLVSLHFRALSPVFFCVGSFVLNLFLSCLLEIPELLDLSSNSVSVRCFLLSRPSRPGQFSFLETSLDLSWFV